MNSMTLEIEFNIYRDIHKASILTAYMAKFFKDKQSTGITIPNFMQDNPLVKANNEVQRLMCENREEFERLYNLVWNEIAELLP